MMEEVFWTEAGARLQCQSSNKKADIHWLFLPGGPGLGSEALAGLTKLLKNKIPGTLWHLDLPNDGSNILPDKPLTNWRQSILEATNYFEKVILVAHSTPGMYIQTMPELENTLDGLVLIGTAPDASWQKLFWEYCEISTDEAMLKAEKTYLENPDNETLRKLLIAAAKNCFITEKSLRAGKKLFRTIPVNHLASELSAQIFDMENYKATWIPQKVKTLIMTGSGDYLTPLELFKIKEQYQRENILIKEITGGGHYPWFENPEYVLLAFQEYFSIF